MHYRNFKSAAACCLLLTAPTAALAEDTLFSSSDGSFVIFGGVGLANVKADEFVYNNGKKLSELNWESKGITLFTIGADAQLDKNWSIRGDFNVGTGGDGHMVDYDWMSATHDEWSDRSTHPDTQLDHYFSGSLEVDRAVYSDDSTNLAVGLGFRYTDVKWTAYGGSYIYSSGDPLFRDLTGTFTPGEKGISYQQQIPVGFLSVNGEHKVGKFTISGGLEGGLSFGIDDIDDHWQRDLRFYDSMKAAPMVGAKVSVDYALTESASLYVSGAYQQVFHAYGDMKYYDTTTDTLVGSEKDAAGATFQSMSVSFGLKGTF
ncbi:MAG TPA: omptin family outer membrane protease [Rhizobium sp.]|nr:omptin family outer membrane protease [Rhizobium sp.]